jgi:DNA repair exonuclease SbcCD ATPase subunit
VEAAGERIQQIQEELQALKAALKEGSARLKAHREKKQELLGDKTKLEMDLKDLQEKIELEVLSRPRMEKKHGPPYAWRETHKYSAMDVIVVGVTVLLGRARPTAPLRRNCSSCSMISLPSNRSSCM